MPSGPKKSRAQKKKKEIAADRKKTENEVPPEAISEVFDLIEAENSPVMQTEITETVLPEKMLASQVLDLKRKDTEEGIKKNALPTEISSTVQSLNVAEHLAAPRVIQLESKDKDGGKPVLLSDVPDREAFKRVYGLNYDNITELALVQNFKVNNYYFGFFFISNIEGMPVLLLWRIKTLLWRKIEEAFQENEVEVAVQNKEDATSEYFSETEKNALKAIAENVLDATEKAVQIHEVEAAAENKDLDLVVAADNRIAVENQEKFLC
ncbi:hypothetical protein AgCh_003720 [Apium graveolens]